VSIGGNINGTLADNVTIRFVTDNTGPWFLHWWVYLSIADFVALISFHRSHIDFHLAA
jgi:iron transport multicopper oxidase